MRLIFAGTPDFASLALQSIIAAGHEVALVLTQPDRASGRGMALRASPVKELALASGIAVLQPSSLKKDFSAQEHIRTLGAEAMVVAAYGLILPQTVLDMPTFGCINIHASLLPRWRGAAPVQRAILAGDAVTGVSIMQMEAGLDSGPLLLCESLPIAAEDTAATLTDRLALLGGRLIVDALAGLPLPPQAQAEGGVTYAAKIDKAEAALDWRLPAAQLARCVRAFNPFPGASCAVDGTLLKVWRATAIAGHGQPGEILAAERSAIVVACGEGALRLDELQKPGGKRLAAAQFLVGTPIAAGSRCALPVT
ncbi:MAG: Methionyl-tRNA formyltransferase [Candidatus Accumulibacter appositus]|uniref:Methionyl-tRNA formyltransferase n=1 Tax=Candidatus Accumulibacter appositus TaxID=1454003 RepID=A0A011QF80_9PROT|nr:methionyl-tRNA formyltransferase [Accumulibacter sp.]EXI77444.1 MAG: Methionyl-tRNA formyltransferase [Candidatus Accumulibacter appositus]HRF04766.1 methionyl-tRNA formyltransferase [Accumulibacter sp.]